MGVAGSLAGHHLEDIARFLLVAGRGHVATFLSRAPAARVVWLNERYVSLSHKSAAETSDELIDRCAFASCAVHHRSGRDTLAIADRYGGRGIGWNGGSGRAAMLGGYYVKGIGPTPLVSPKSDEMHRSGTMALHEGIREAIFSELVAAEFPYGAVPVVAIIQIQRESSDTRGSCPGYSYLLVRPPFLRPAHFERAPNFVSRRGSEGVEDTRRVAMMVNGLVEELGHNGVRSTFESFWKRWATQAAYGYVNRMPHGTTGTSNVSLDGRLVDFGSMAALSNIASTTMGLSMVPTGQEVDELVNNFSEHSYFLRRYIPRVFDPSWLQHQAGQIERSYWKRAERELLENLGLTPDCIIRRHAIRAEARRLLARYGRVHQSIINSSPKPDFPLSLFWSDVPPPHLASLRGLIEATIDPSVLHAARARSILRMLPRPDLSRERLAAILESEFGLAVEGDMNLPERIQSFVRGMVCRNRRAVPRLAGREVVHAILNSSRSACAVVGSSGPNPSLHSVEVRRGWGESQSRGQYFDVLNVGQELPQLKELFPGSDFRPVANT